MDRYLHCAIGPLISLHTRHTSTHKLCKHTHTHRLGYAPRQMTGLDLQALIPPPYGQLHQGFMKVGFYNTPDAAPFTPH